jgi:uncharacterized protein (DUF885 family)/alpha-beta hydrolase superfamily lysophospholipase
MRLTRALTLTVLVLLPGAEVDGQVSARAGALASEYLAAYQSRYPESDPANRDGLFDNSRRAYAAWDRAEDRFLTRLRVLTPELDHASPEALTLGLLRERLAMSRQFRSCRRELWNVGPLTGWLNEYRGYAARHPGTGEPARQAALRRWGKLPGFIRIEIENLRAGLRAGYTAPRLLVSAAIAQADAVLSLAPTESPFFAPASNDSSTAFRAAFESLVRDSIVPALRRYREFLADEYAPRARTSVGVGALPDGATCFRALIRRYTTLDVPPAQLGASGRAMLEADDALVLRRRQVQLIADTANRFLTSAEALGAMRDALTRAAGAAPRWFGRLPEILVPSVDSMPDGGHADPDAQYVPGGRDEPPRVYVNVPRLLEPGGRLQAERLAFHEGVPGHHLQIALARSADAHPLNRVLSNTAFGEGWAVYASNLAAEMGLYSTEATRFAASAARLHDGLTFVIQHGLHAQGWTRSQAVDTMLKYSGGGAAEAAQQIDYFIAAPAHALAYPMGAKYIEDLRGDATRRLGSRFSPTAFHDVVLASGALPLAVLKDVVDRWIATRQRPDSLRGTWRGYWSRAGDTMLVSMKVRRDSGAGAYVATFDADRLRVSGIPFTEAQLEGCCSVRLVLRGDRTTMVFSGTLRGDSLSGTFREGTSEGRFAYSRITSATPGFGEREITFANDTVTLAGSLLLPPEGDSLPAVVFLQGSGPESRWASRYLASELADRGIAALIYDKRGVGGSSGDWRQATLDDLAADGAAAVARLHQEPRIARGRIGLHGHSQGGTLAPLVAAQSTGIAFIIGSAAAGLPTDSTELYSILNSVYPLARTVEDSANAKAYASELVAVAYWGRSRERLDSLAVALRDRPWFFAPPPANASYWSFSRGFAQYRALDWWARFGGPVLLVYGAEDQRVQAVESAARITTALRSAGNVNVTVRIFPGADHTFRLAPGPGGWPMTAPGYVDTVLDWLSRR